jgi:hypothetical protein
MRTGAVLSETKGWLPPAKFILFEQAGIKIWRRVGKILFYDSLAQDSTHNT